MMTPDRDCPFDAGLSSLVSARRARTYLAEGSLELPPHAPVSMACPPDWSADPFDDANWRYQLHSLRWAQGLKRLFDDEGDPVALQRYLEILEDWHQRNRWSAPPSDQSWADHSTAIRARVYAACAQAHIGDWPAWLRIALDEHVDALTDPAIYPTAGNHALNQNVGLFAAATMLGRTVAASFAIQRTADLLERSVDEQGVTDEQSTEYQIYNFRRYREAAELFGASGADLPDVFSRIELMPEMIGHATLPNGQRVMVGDACDDPGYRVPGTLAEYATTAGQQGPRPDTRVKKFDRGYVFARTGWGEHRPFRDEHHLTLRFGPARIPHGHHDAGAVSLAALGQRIINAPGKYAYRWDEFRAHVLSRRAQNTLSLDAPYGPDGGSSLRTFDDDGRLLVVVIDDQHYPDVAVERTVIFDQATGMLVVSDVFATRAAVACNAEQRFVLDPNFSVVVTRPNEIVAAADGVSVTIRQLADGGPVAAQRGETDPLEGWVSYHYGERTPATAIVTPHSGTLGHYVTAIHAGRSTDDFPEVRFDAASRTVHLGDGQAVQLKVSV